MTTARLTEARRAYGAACVARDAHEREHGLNPSTKTLEQIAEHDKLLLACVDARAALVIAEREETGGVSFTI